MVSNKNKISIVWIFRSKIVKTNSVQCREAGTVQSTSFTENMAGKTGRIFVAKPEILGDVYIVACMYYESRHALLDFSTMCYSPRPTMYTG